MLRTCAPDQATAGMEDGEEFQAQDLGSGRPGHTIGQPSIMTGMSRNLVHSNSIAPTSVAPSSAAPHAIAPNSIASQPNIPVRTRFCSPSFPADASGNTHRVCFFECVMTPVFQALFRAVVIQAKASFQGCPVPPAQYSGVVQAAVAPCLPVHSHAAQQRC